MSMQGAWNGRMFRGGHGVNDAMRSRVLSEVQITGIPKASTLEVDSTA